MMAILTRYWYTIKFSLIKNTYEIPYLLITKILIDYQLYLSVNIVKARVNLSMNYSFKSIKNHSKSINAIYWINQRPISDSVGLFIIKSWFRIKI